MNRFWVYKNVELQDEERQAQRNRGRRRTSFVAYRLFEPVVDKKTGEIIAEGETRATEEFLTELAGKVGENTVIKLYSRTETTQDILDMFSTRNTLEIARQRKCCCKSARSKTFMATAKRFWSRRTT